MLDKIDQVKVDTDVQQQILMLIPSPESKRQFKKYVHT